MTDAEQLFWQHLRRKQIKGLQFYRQKPLLHFIVDFYCPKVDLVIEVDGGQHFERTNQLKDQQRDEALANIGLNVIRFDNLQVLKETDNVLNVIYQYINERIPPKPLFAMRGIN
jgi:very-short-patch-repair endonuclease